MKTLKLKDIYEMSYENAQDYLEGFSTVELEDLKNELAFIDCPNYRERQFLKVIKSILSDRE